LKQFQTWQKCGTFNDQVALVKVEAKVEAKVEVIKRQIHFLTTHIRHSIP
jgi:hypothetical protein